MKSNYVCSFCGKGKVKLWRPFLGTYPLVCAECAEKRQPKYFEYLWENKDGSFLGTPTGQQLILPKNIVINEKGQIPVILGHAGGPLIMSNRLRIDLSDVSKGFSSKATLVVYAAPDKKGNFRGETSFSDEMQSRWEALPTR